MTMQNKTKAYELNQSPFYKLRGRKRLSSLLSTPEDELERLARGANNLYHEFSVAKKSGGTRGVENPAAKLKAVQGRLARWLNRVKPPDYLFCPVKGRCYVGNAARHRGQRVVRCLDIRKYYPNTPSRRVFWFFHKVMQCEIDIAATLTNLATYNGHLPTGSPLSPILAFFAYVDVWDDIAAVCREHGYRLTVYIDDVTISADKISAEVMWKIKSTIHRAGLRYHKEKSYEGRAAEITGVIVHGEKLIAPNRQLQKVKAVKDALRGKEPEYQSRFLQDRLNGLQGQLAQIANKNYYIRRV